MLGVVVGSTFHEGLAHFCVQVTVSKLPLNWYGLLVMPICKRLRGSKFPNCASVSSYDLPPDLVQGFLHGPSNQPRD